MSSKKFQIINHTRRIIAYTDDGAGYGQYSAPGENYSINTGKAQIDDKHYTNKGYKILTGYDQ
jgi:hypothetical protein